MKGINMLDASSWRNVHIGDERVMLLRSNGVSFGFGFGPSSSIGAHTERIQKFIDGWPGGRLRGCWCRQVHGSDIWHVDGCSAASRVECAGERDGLVTREQDIALFVWTADCVPILLAGSGVVSAVHAGWRGLAGGIIPRALNAVVQVQRNDEDSLTAYIGPAIGSCHYEIDEPVIEALSASGVEPHHWLDGRQADLRALARIQLINGGVDPKRVYEVGSCTACDPRYASFRRDGSLAGRQLSMVVLE
ncbi:MAG: polyphenol oxidase family protein [bacterium]|nr:polyphenol oxidase family protein [bacterium]